MDDFTPSIDRRSGRDINGSPPGTKTYSGVRGWLLVLCLMLTIIGPLISAWLMTYHYRMFAPHFGNSVALQAAIFASLAITACSVAFGVYAGFRLWLIRPNAVATARYALLLGLAADIVTASIQLAAGPNSVADDGFVWPLTISLIPGLIFFTVCLGYLNKSRRVCATYQHDQDRDCAT